MEKEHANRQHSKQRSPDRYNERQTNYTVKDLVSRFDELEGYISKYIEDAAQRLADVESGIKELNAIADERGKNMNFTQETVKTLQQHFDRMEKGLLSEFKISQEIMRAMLEHDMNIERAKLDLKNEMERREQKMREQQEKRNLIEQDERNKFKRKLYTRMVTIFAPILIAATTLIVSFIERFL